MILVDSKKQKLQTLGTVETILSEALSVIAVLKKGFIEECDEGDEKEAGEVFDDNVFEMMKSVLDNYEKIVEEEMC